MRLFLAVEIPLEIRKKLAAFAGKLHEFVIGSFVPLNNYHVTLRFLGDVNEDQVDSIKKVCSDAASKERRKMLYVDGIKVFPSKNFIRIISAGTSNDSFLKNIFEKIDTKLDAAGFKTDHSFDSHITLVRVKKVLEKSNLLNFLDKNQSVRLGGFDVTEIKLMKSKLASPHPIYTEIAAFKLA